uniref:Uncharacterized protein n=1 Tax=Anguilla anguilla TaxID=7936 RepID=A0A0E9X463_ANGAN
MLSMYKLQSWYNKWIGCICVHIMNEYIMNVWQHILSVCSKQRNEDETVELESGLKCSFLDVSPWWWFFLCMRKIMSL